jgi:molybdate transport system substrate-binding protein
VTLGALLLLLPCVVSAGCGPTAPARQNGKRQTEINVFAASSLENAFRRLEEDLGRQHPAVTVTFHFAGSQELRMQIQHGASADVFASADLRHMDELRRTGRVDAPHVFARNEPVLVVAKDAASRIHSLADLPRAQRLVLGAKETPIGDYTRKVLERARRTLGVDFPERVESRVVSRELNVRQVLAKVILGEADAGIVYRTDVHTATDTVVVVPLPKDDVVVAEYPIATVAGGAHAEAARAWLDLVLSPAGQDVLIRFGFLPATRDPVRP